MAKRSITTSLLTRQSVFPWMTVKRTSTGLKMAIQRIAHAIDDAQTDIVSQIALAEMHDATEREQADHQKGIKFSVA
jgi:hypothetical protein